MKGLCLNIVLKFKILFTKVDCETVVAKAELKFLTEIAYNYLCKYKCEIIVQ